MSLEEANYFVRFHIDYVGDQWRWRVETMQPYGPIIGYNYYDTPNEALEELKDFMRYFTKNVLKNGDTIRAYVNKHNPDKKND